MRILLFESNLMWSSKLKVGLKALGHEVEVLTRYEPGSRLGEIAIVNLAQPNPAPRELIDALHGDSIKVVAHAGHKEKDLLTLGREAGADVLATNGELSAKLEDVLLRVTK